MQEQKIERIKEALLDLIPHENECRLCPRECGVNRSRGEKGFCQMGARAFLSHALLHYGEEPILSGHHDCGRESNPDRPPQRASGALFFSGCNLKCLFCQNYLLSWLNQGTEISPEELAAQMLDLQKSGALNINLISPTHIIVPILKALKSAYKQGLRLPIVYNSNGYEKVDVIKRLDGIVDIYLPDLKYFSPRWSEKFSGAKDYFCAASQVIREMHRQQPELVCNDSDIAEKGLVIRHLILPTQSEDSLHILEWIARTLTPRVCLSLMRQYWPCFKAPLQLQRILDSEEYNKVLDRALELGFETLFFQPDPFTPDEHRLPDFNSKDPFEWT